MHRSGKGKNVASILKYHGKMWYNFAVPHFAIPNFAPAKIPPPRYSGGRESQPHARSRAAVWVQVG